MLNIFNGMTKEALTQSSKLFYRVRGEELEPRLGPSFLSSNLSCWGQEFLQVAGDGARGGVGGVDNAHVRWRHAMQ